ncbi:RIIa domain-containing protein 1 isoform 1-T1 [Ara ararauna]
MAPPPLPPPPRPHPPSLRLSAERYLRAHPAVALLLRGFLRELLLQRPNDVLGFAAGEGGQGVPRSPHGARGTPHNSGER